MWGEGREVGKEHTQGTTCCKLSEVWGEDGEEGREDSAFWLQGGDGMMVEAVEEELQVVRIEIPKPHSEGQDRFVRCVAKRQMVKAGRRWGKTVGGAIKALCAFQGICNACLGDGCIRCDNTGRVKPTRVLYLAPTAEQVGKFWFEVTEALYNGVEIGVYRKDETEKVIEVPRTELRIKAKTAWNANTGRGDFGGLVIHEEYQLMNEDCWQDVTQPMLLDNDGTAIFIFTPPSLKSEGVSKAKDPRHASKLFKKAEQDKSGRWQTFHFTSYDNPTLSKDALRELTQSDDMSRDSYRREILAEDDEIETSWLVYSKFNEEVCKIKRFEIPREWPVVSGHDFGSANPAGLFVAQVKLPLPLQAPKYLRYGDYVAFAEYAPGGGFSAEQHIESFRGICEGKKVAKSVGGNLTTEKEIRDLYTKSGWQIDAPLISRVNAQIDCVIRVMEQNQFYIFDDLFRFLAQISDCMWILDTDQRPTNKIRDEASYHLLACLRYMATVFKSRMSVSDDEDRAPVATIKG